MKTVLLKPIFSEEHTSSSTQAPEDRPVGICFKYIPSSLVVPEEKLEPFESPLTESNLKFHTTIVSIVFKKFSRSFYVCTFHVYRMTLDDSNSSQ